LATKWTHAKLRITSLKGKEEKQTQMPTVAWQLLACCLLLRQLDLETYKAQSHNAFRKCDWSRAAIIKSQQKTPRISTNVEESWKEKVSSTHWVALQWCEPCESLITRDNSVTFASEKGPDRNHT